LFPPAIHSGLDHPVANSIFVDAALPARTGPTAVASPELLEFLLPMAVNGRLPRWTDWWDEADVAPMFADPMVRQTIIAEQPTLPLSYYEQHIPVPDGCSNATELRERLAKNTNAAARSGECVSGDSVSKPGSVTSGAASASAAPASVTWPAPRHGPDWGSLLSPPPDVGRRQVKKDGSSESGTGRTPNSSPPTRPNPFSGASSQLQS
jgi:hypothetical protein